MRRTARNAKHLEQTRPGFSLVELLVVISVIMILVGLSLPAIRASRQSAGAAVSLSNLRGIGVVFELYTQAYSGVYPYHGPDVMLPFVISPPGEPERTFVHGIEWAISYHWPAKMHAVAPWREHYKSWINIGKEARNDDPPWKSTSAVSYRYSCSFFASPRTWTVGEQLSAEELIRPIRVSDVRFPALKAMMFDHDRAYLDAAADRTDRRGVLMADGSASLRSDSAATTPVQNRLDILPPRIYSDTEHGVHGRDVR